MVKKKHVGTYTKYLPVTLFKLGSRATKIGVIAPCLAVLVKGHMKGLTINVAIQLLKKLMCRIISVSTIPGCTAFTVTPVP